MGDHLHVAIVGMALLAALAFALLVSMTVSTRTADAQVVGTFDQPQICDGTGLFSQGFIEGGGAAVNRTQFNTVDTEQVPFRFDQVGPRQTFVYNALAYRASDNFVYGYRFDTDNLIRIDRQGDVQNYPTPAGLPNQDYSNAAIQQRVNPPGSSLLYLYNNNGATDINNDGVIENQQVYVVNLDNNTVSTITTVNAQGTAVRLNVIDFAFRQDGLLYGADPNGNVVSLDPATGLVTRTPVPNLVLGAYGGAFFNQNGDLFVIGNFDGSMNNRGNFFQIDLDGGAPQILSRNVVPQSASNDATACYLPQQPNPDPTGPPTIGRPYNADVKLTTQGPAQVEPGGPLTYTHTVLQSGPDNAPNVSVETTLPEGATYNPTGSGGPGWTCSAAPPNPDDRVVVTCNRTDELPLGNAPPLTVNATAPDEPVDGPLVADAAVSVPDRNGEDLELDADEDDNTSQVSTNAGPTAVDDTYTATVGQPLTGNVITNQENGQADNDINGDNLTVADADPGTPGIQPVSGPTKGTLTLNADGTFTYTPNPGATGTDTFVYRISDGNGGTDTATVTINLNRPPVAVDDTYAIQSGQSVNSNVLTNVEGGDQDSDPDNDPLTVVDADPDTPGVQPVSGPSNGTLTLNADGTFNYTPDAGFSGTDTFEYRISDGNGGFDIGKVFISVNGAPVAVDDDYTTPFETRLTGNIITNPDGTDSDPNGDTLRVVDADPNTPGVQPISGPTNGTLVLRPDGSFVYTPNDGFSGTDTFTYTVSDGNGGVSNVATVTINVPNGPPVARDNRYRTPFNTTLNQGTPGILVNDSDPNGDTLTVVDTDPNTPGIQPVSGTRNGKLTLNADGSFKYVPNRGFTGTDTFTYRISDGNGGTDEATVTIVVDPKPAPKADLQIKVNSPERVDQGDRFKYTLTVKNNGPDGAKNVRVVSKIPPGVEFVSAPKGCKYDASNRTVTCNVGNLSDDQVKKLQITVRAVKPGKVTLRGCYVRSDTADPNSSNNSDR